MEKKSNQGKEETDRNQQEPSKNDGTVKRKRRSGFWRPKREESAEK